jgi:NADH:ubiquinone oxidoreductase subunit H
MYYSPTIISLIEVVLVLVPALVGIAYVTIAERKTMASMQRRLGPNAVGQFQIILFKRSYLFNNRIFSMMNKIFSQITLQE